MVSKGGRTAKEGGIPAQSEYPGDHRESCPSGQSPSARPFGASYRWAAAVLRQTQAH